MSKNPFKVLGVKDTATQTEVDDAYYEAKKPYEELRFFEGERGDEACRKLTELKDAYEEASSIIASQYVVSSDDSDIIKKVEGLLKDLKLDEAQAELNTCREHTAHWHFLQAGIFFKRDWHNEALVELRQAISMDPQNRDYQVTYQNVLKKVGGQGQGAGFYQNRQNGANPNRSYTGADNPYGYGNGRGGMDACDCCSSLICADCCCECMGGDLIRCC